MFFTYQRMVKKALLIALLLIAVLSGYFFRISLVAFQKVAMIAPADVIPGEVLAAESIGNGRAALDVRRLLEPIPYQENNKAIYDIYPPDRYHRAIEMGYGNCSNLVFGMSFLLLKRDQPFQIVHFMPYEGFLMGLGHTVLNMPYALDGVRHVGVVDVFEGGLPRVNDSFIDLPVLLHKHLEQVSILPLNGRKDDDSVYYGDFLNNAAVGVVSGGEIARYFDFIDRIYVPLGSKRLERIIYSAIAIVADRYPHTYVTRADYARLFAGKAHLLWMAQALIWLARLALCLILALLLTCRLSFRSAQVKSIEVLEKTAQ